MGESKAEKGPEDVKIVDRRLFDAQGNLRDDDPVEEASSEPNRASSAPAPENAEHPEPRRAAHGEKAASINFATFVMSMSVNGMVALGAIPHAATKTAELDIDGARQIIDILAMLRDKTEGNRTPEETQIIESSLYELRMTFVEKARGSAQN